jgi:hypothetical protein
MSSKKKWMKDAFGCKRKGALHKQLGVPQDKPIPKTLLHRIQSAKQGSTIKNPAKTGRKRIAVTGLLKKRVNPVLTAIKINKRRR